MVLSSLCYPSCSKRVLNLLVVVKILFPTVQKKKILFPKRVRQLPSQKLHPSFDMFKICTCTSFLFCLLIGVFHKAMDVKKHNNFTKELGSHLTDHNWLKVCLELVELDMKLVSKSYNLYIQLFEVSLSLSLFPLPDRQQIDDRMLDVLNKS